VFGVVIATDLGTHFMDILSQVGALPIRSDGSGGTKILLVTSRESQRWIIPKGWPWRDTPDHIAAVNEAREEAGIIGEAEAEIFGAYRYMKRRKHDVVPVIVNVFRMTVVEELATWPEAHQRKRAWFSLSDAAAAIEEIELRELIQRISA
jgi:8-oxo-dGTP pyrophosphatase MutT (NUDIX family)